ncbi:hypothetical protein OUZ56_011793 [Daphnia magna]|uniref:Uncharacterized protein n=1 Tax=Daphnia magna TaxID=35525 RepID=A0ABQ9Z1A4_9CRUS|nr:hypothetical protein OUZ56_011793 [Daphnia magna]
MPSATNVNSEIREALSTTCGVNRRCPLPRLGKLCPLLNCNNGFVLFNYKGAINLYFVYNINISLKSVFEIHGANLPHYHCQLTPLVGHELQTCPPAN